MKAENISLRNLIGSDTPFLIPVFLIEEPFLQRKYNM